jgi:DNA-binding CsgD family transcriptional regulator
MLKDRGMSNRQIATLLNMTEEAVKQFFKRMAQKFHVRGFHAVIRVARRECAF